jgi:hypothetical protein
MGLLGLVGGLLIGIIASRVVAARPSPGFLKAFGTAQLVVLGLIGTIGGTSRLLAHVPPTIDGESLLLAVELRFPDSARDVRDRVPGEWRVRLRTSSGGANRISREGPLWTDDARTEGGRWIVPGAVELFTSRGARLLTIEPDSVLSYGFEVPLPAYPGKTQLAWSEWLPRGDATTESRGVTYRFRVVPRSQPIRTEHVGPFEVQTIASGFREAMFHSGPPAYEADATFAIRYRGAPVRITTTNGDSSRTFDRVHAVAVVGGTPPALVVQADAQYGAGSCHLVVGDGPRVRAEPLSDCGEGASAFPLTADSSAFQQAVRRHVLDGRIDRASFARAGLYLFDNVALDTRTLAVHRFTVPEPERLVAKVPPLDLSPDERSFVRLRFATAESDAHALSVTDMISGTSHVLPTGLVPVLGEEYEQLDPTWLHHYFTWTHRDGQPDRLEPRPNVQPMAHRGVLQEETGYREYRVYGATAALRTAMVDFLVTEFKGVRATTDSAAFSHEVRVGERVVHVSFGNDGQVGVWMDRDTDTQLVAQIAARFDAALATRKYDALFTR